MMQKTRFKELRLKFLSVSVIVTSLALLILQTIIYLNRTGYIVLPEVLLRVLSSISLVIAIFFSSSLLLRLTIRRVFRLFDEPEERIFYSKIYSWTLYCIGLFVVLHHFGVSLGNITLFIGLLATGLAFAIRDVLLSFFGWMILLRKKPFRIGDYIRIGEDEGKVLHIGTFYVLLDKTKELPEDYTRVPNRLFLEKSIANLGKTIFHEQLRFPLAAIPENRQQKAEELLRKLNTMVSHKDFQRTYLDLDNEKLVLVIEYLVSFDEKVSVRSRVIEVVASLYPNHLKF